MNKTQVIKCKCGSIYAGCVEPECYFDAAWIKSMQKALKKGHIIDMINNKDFEFQKCKCEIQKKLKL